ncbi:DUF4870 domain-containing protein [Prochlorothrix hollandica]|uniref:DUF4870 domain-containing protein n=1 Tax=Prochlorothrix hollandica PCC 9006 = CALU 1027 TaxID=317619 RepID=A0A0M2PWM3_PROHO|nr:DUF4870 domain-containing protein [Prochlorothrix hollandica]KKI99078.1 hypothetical protein PROH_14910 [Prochlorothrix hollandica PCC 9006 = CALU 1027]
MQSTYDPDKRKLLSLVCHGSVFASTLVVGVSIPIIILMVSDDLIVKNNAKEAINFQITAWIWTIIVGILTFISFGLLGFVLIPIAFIAHWALAIWAIVFVLGHANQAVRYPFILHIL